jgi:hypothetical protein
VTSDPGRPRPVFRAAHRSSDLETPEKLFYRLSGRTSTHRYLRGPQQDVLREYASAHLNTSDVAFELPTQVRQALPRRRFLAYDAP